MSTVSQMSVSSRVNARALFRKQGQSPSMSKAFQPVGKPFRNSKLYATGSGVEESPAVETEETPAEPEPTPPVAEEEGFKVPELKFPSFGGGDSTPKEKKAPVVSKSAAEKKAIAEASKQFKKDFQAQKKASLPSAEERAAELMQLKADKNAAKEAAIAKSQSKEFAANTFQDKSAGGYQTFTTVIALAVCWVLLNYIYGPFESVSSSATPCTLDPLRCFFES